MKVILKPIGGTAKANLERAREEVIRVLGFRGNVVTAETSGTDVVVRFEINPQWGLTPEEKVSYLKEWIPAKVRSIFKVLSVSEK
jgi:hypothetical protein